LIILETDNGKISTSGTSTFGTRKDKTIGRKGKGTMSGIKETSGPITKEVFLLSQQHTPKRLRCGFKLSNKGTPQSTTNRVDRTQLINHHLK
jgi:hypothetical protein